MQTSPFYRRLIEQLHMIKLMQPVLVMSCLEAGTSNASPERQAYLGSWSAGGEAAMSIIGDMQITATHIKWSGSRSSPPCRNIGGAQEEITDVQPNTGLSCTTITSSNFTLDPLCPGCRHRNSQSACVRRLRRHSTNGSPGNASYSHVECF
jgi:hypothetical protein